MTDSPITPRAKDFAQWYQDVVLQGDMAEPAEVVKGCMVIRPTATPSGKFCSVSSTIASKPQAIKTSICLC